MSWFSAQGLRGRLGPPRPEGSSWKGLSVPGTGVDGTGNSWGPRALWAAVARLKACCEELRHFDWDELTDFDTAGSWPAAVQSVLLLLVFMLTSAAGYLWLVTSLQSELAQGRSQLQQMQRELLTEASVAAALEDMQRRLPAAGEALAGPLRSLPRADALPELLDELSLLGKRNGLVFSRLQLGEQMEGRMFIRQDIELRALGVYHDFARFISDLGASSWLVTAGDFLIQPAPEASSLEMVLTLHTFLYPQPGAHDTEEAAAAQSWHLHAVLGRSLTHAAAAGTAADPLPVYRAHAARSPFHPTDSGTAVRQMDDLPPDLQRTPEPLEQFVLDSLLMLGSFRRGNETVALLLDSEQRVHRVRPGDYAGQDHGLVRSVGNRQIELLERVRSAEGRWLERRRILSMPQE